MEELTGKEHVDFSKYKDAYSDELFKKFVNGEVTDVNDVKKLMFGWTFRPEYGNGEIPDEFSAEYWERKADELYDTDDMSFEKADAYDRNSMLIMHALESTGDGKTPETAIHVICVPQEYEYMQNVPPYDILKRRGQSVCDGIDCIYFEKNTFGIGRLYFNVERVFDGIYAQMFQKQTGQ